MSYLAYYGYWNADYPVDWDSKVLAEGWTHGQFEADQFAFHYFADEPDFASWAKKSFLTAEEGIANMRVIDAVYRAAGMKPRGT